MSFTIYDTLLTFLIMKKTAGFLGSKYNPNDTLLKRFFRNAFVISSNIIYVC